MLLATVFKCSEDVNLSNLYLGTLYFLHRIALKLFMHVQEMTPEADIISTRFTKSIIKSAAALSYVEAQARMDDRYAFIYPWILCDGMD